MSARRLLRTARRRAGLTQRELAARSGVPQSTIARIESGAADVRVATLERLLRACEQTLEVYDGSGDGVDGTLLDAMLRLPPADRVARAAEWAEAAGRIRLAR